MTASPALSPVMHLYLDETGARHPDRAAVVPKHGCDWFAIGGMLINEEDIDHAKAELAAFVHCGIGKDLSPFVERLVGGDEHGSALVASADQLEQQRWSTRLTNYSPQNDTLFGYHTAKDQIVWILMLTS
jgi:hypothetical protein